MNKKISFKLFFTVVFRTINQVSTYILKLLSFKDMSIFGKIVWRTFQACFAIWMLFITLVLGYELVDNFIYRPHIKPYISDSYWSTTTLSNDIQFKYNHHTCKGYVYNDYTEKVTIKNVCKVWQPVNDDTLAVFVQDNKRGYLNRFTGEVVIPAQYTKAWMFSGGLAAVEKDKKILFINRAGDVVIDKNLYNDSNLPHFLFIKGYCPVAEKTSNKVGLIDRQGNWVVTPQYDIIKYQWGILAYY